LTDIPSPLLLLLEKKVPAKLGHATRSIKRLLMRSPLNSVLVNQEAIIWCNFPQLKRSEALTMLRKLALLEGLIRKHMSKLAKNSALKRCTVFLAMDIL